MKYWFDSLLTRNPGGWTGIDMQGGVFGVNVRLPRAPQEKAVVLQHVALPGEASDVAALLQVGRVLSSEKFDVVNLLNRHDYQILMVDKPAVRVDELESSLRLALSPLLEFSVDEANVAWLDIPVRQTMGSRVVQLYAAVAQTELVNRRTSLFEDAKIRLDALDIRESAQRNIAFMLDNNKSATCLVFADAEGVQLTITSKGELYLVRFLNEALLKHAPSEDKKPLDDAVERLALEIQRSFDFVRRNYPSLLIDGLYVAPTAEDIDLPNRLKPHLIEDVRALDLSAIFDWPAGSDLDQPQTQAQFFHALGSTLRIPGKE